MSPITTIAALLVAAPAVAQQFQLVPGSLSGSAQTWTESVECADVDRDGDLDAFFANGGGFSSASAIAYQHQLSINQGGLTFADESLARLGAHVTCSKRVVTGDIDGDGWVDAMFLNCFDGSLPSLYRNRGAAQPGHFAFEGAQRGFTEALDSYAGQFGDIDDDGDLDVVISDSTTFWSQLDSIPAVFGHPRLYRNDGQGFFAEVVGPAWAPVDSTGTHDVQIVDIDGDYDADVLASNVSLGVKKFYLMLNDGSGNFTDADSLLPAAGANVWESEVADLDGDRDTDLFVLGVTDGPSPQFWLGRHGAFRNDVLRTGSFGFSPTSASGGTDINEVVLFDYDVDGDLDAFISTLGVPANQVQQNQGGLQFQITPGVLPPGLDVQNPTLDATAADLDGDGDYDYLSVQGEYAGADWRNTLFENLGPRDTLAPVITRWERLAGPRSPSGPWVVHAQVRDQVVDDGKDWVTASARYAVRTPDGAWHPARIDGLSVASGLRRFELPDTASGQGVALVYALHFVDAAGNRSNTRRHMVVLQ
ncbi:MAG: VCBS repeat-containing protein [Planctomycetota bacterium]|nr:VCBS repeat-containing protein [Planctomycetota bacterium]